MKIKRYWLASVVLFVFILLFETVVHGKLLMNLYAMTPNIWRSNNQMMNYIPFNIAIMIAISLWVTFIFCKLYPTGGYKNGLKFGFYIGVLSGIQAAGAYYYLPIGAALAVCWFIANLIENMIAGLLIGFIYH